MVSNACDKADTSTFFDIVVEGNTSQINNGETIGIAIANKKEKNIEKVLYSLDDKTLVVSNNKVTIDTESLGSKTLKATVFFDEDSVQITKISRY